MGDSFLLVGGYVDDSLLGVTDTIYKYEHDSWTELETKLPLRGMENLMAIMVDLDIFPSCSGEEVTTQEATSQEATTQGETTQEATTQEVTTPDASDATTQEETTITSAVTSLHGNVSLAFCVISVWMFNTMKS